MRQKFPLLADDPDFYSGSFAFNIDEMLSADQVRLMRWALQCLTEKYRAFDGRGRPVDWTEWKLIISAGYGCGFVCKDLDAEEGHRIFYKLLDSSSEAGRLTIRQLRALFHYIIRSERWGDMGGDRGGNTLWVFLESDAAEAVRNRLSEV